MYLWTQGSDSSIVHEGSQGSLSRNGISKASLVSLMSFLGRTLQTRKQESILIDN